MVLDLLREPAGLLIRPLCRIPVDRSGPRGVRGLESTAELHQVIGDVEVGHGRILSSGTDRAAGGNTANRHTCDKCPIPHVTAADRANVSLVAHAMKPLRRTTQQRR